MIRYLPLIVHEVVYLFTFTLGAILLLVGWWPFEFYLRKYSGIVPFWLSSHQLLTVLLLGFGAPIALAVGYAAAIRRWSGSLPSPSLRTITNRELWLAAGATSLSFLAAVSSLYSGGAVGRVGAWFDYQAWVASRWLLFERLSFFEFVNIYGFLPTFTSILCVCLIRHARDGRIALIRASVLILFSILPVVVIDLLLFQKKSLLASLLLIGMSGLVDWLVVARTRRLSASKGLVPMAVGGLFLYVTYTAMVAAPILREEARAMPEDVAQPGASGEIPLIGTLSPAGDLVRPAGETGASRPIDAPTAAQPSTAEIASGASPAGQPGPTPKLAAPTPAAPGPPRPADVFAALETIRTGRGTFSPHVTSRRLSATLERWLPGRWVGGDPAPKPGREIHGSRALYATTYVALAPLTRAPVPALAYPAVFPDLFPYYGLDLGLDIFGIGFSPDDNRLLAVYLWPRVQGGSVMAPFQFAIFSQVGLAGALLVAIVLGYALGYVWQLVCTRGAGAAASVMGGLVLLFSALITQDSLRHNVVAAYGVGWHLLVIAAWSLLERRITHSAVANTLNEAA